MMQPAALASPRFRPIIPANIPDLLRALPRWLCWKAEPAKPNGKFGKIPVDPITGRKINGRDPMHWRTFNEVMGGYLSGVADGIGFALCDRHPVNIGGIDFFVTVADFDQCRERMDEIHRLWMELGEPLTELSPSGNGVHMWGLSRVPLKGGNAGEGRELYSGGRFMTMTGISAQGTFRECPGFEILDQRWFPPKATPAHAAPPLAMAAADLPGNPVFGQAGDHWFDRLSPDDKNACLAAMLQVPAVIALADTRDASPSPNWRTVVAACVRSGAPDAYNLCRVWAQTSPRFDANNFDLRWKSYSRG